MTEEKTESVRAIEFALKLMEDDIYEGEGFLSAWMEGNTHEHFPEFPTDAWPGSVSPPVDPKEGAVWLDESDPGPPVAREWDGSMWVEVTGEALATLISGMGDIVAGAGEVAGTVLEGAGEVAGVVLEGAGEVAGAVLEGLAEGVG